ncbi:TPA: DUF2344 domain-containing protein [Candidatus Scatousia excrementigallinarum]|uniref:DUF2344 domain-containing protein n=1 Tax=Candidatus Scatousia excrementigallinarum TaxID=2840935 RepID=A0A9D1EZC4_9BACT|nr:DUF2344 domain-containing protein [Candidatus Scatousia excrementigallinarum]
MDCFFRDYHEALFKCNKPYQYVGGEFLSFNKDFDSAKVRFAFAFPDKYEIGISNLGVRVLYGLVNNQKDYMADRVYAPEPDFQPKELYGLESKRKIKDFDAVGFSLQYEMAYPTVLKMLDMSAIPYRNDERTDNDPIIIAGGPCAFNPLPLADFIDVFMIGDGEDSIIEVCEILDKTKGLPRTERIKALCEGGNSGRWSKFTDGTVTKRIAQLTYETALKSYPIPFSSSVQDRAVVEIRRGCGRMCRFCQPGHVTLPIRERSAEDIIKIAKELVKNTGYDEYSLLSLSSNDYANINEVIKELAVDFNKKKISVSLPSQRIDGFNLELANLVQSVRKSTMTLAPEAGSQRLRDVIKKNITEDMILNAVTTLYENGWSRIKFYFICGLPTETLEDMDEMAELFRKIRHRCRLIKKEKGLTHGMDLTCTLSIFVPKPFTPFQWCGQMNLDKVTEHIKYLKEQIKTIKGVKINYHEKYVSQIEAALTRGDDSLCKYIEALYKKGCYLDAWGEYFDKDIWYETAGELGINLAELAQKEYDLEKPLPWDFIDIGVNKEWFKNEYKEAFNVTPDSKHIVPTCQKKCVNCGVCKNLKIHKVMDKSFKASPQAQAALKIEKEDPKTCKHYDKPIFKYRIKLTKTGILKYFSHLDWQNTFFKAIARTDLNVVFSQGFNPTMKISMGIALPLFAESITELVDIELFDDITPNELKLKLEKVLPPQSQILSIVKIDKSAPAIDITAQWAEYEINSSDKNLYDFDKLKYNTDRVLSSEEIFIEKKNKKGLIKKTDIKPAIMSHRYEGNSLFIVLKTGQGTGENTIPALRADALMNVIAPDVTFNIKRTRFFDRDLREL